MSEVGGGAVVEVPRSSVPVERTWDPEAIFASVEAWEAEHDAVLAELPSLTRFEGRLGEGPDVLVAALEARDEVRARANRVGVYAYLGYAVETTDTDAVARLARAQTLRAAVAAATAHFAPGILAISDEALRAWLAEDERLRVYAHHLGDLRWQEPHVRSPEVEEALGFVSDPFSGVEAIYSALVDSDLRFAPAVGGDARERLVSQGTIYALLADPDRAVRRSAWESFADGYLSVRNTLAASWLTAVKQDVFRTRMRRHGSTLEASLAHSNVPAGVFANVVDTFWANVGTWHRYWRVRRELLGVDRLQPYDVWAPLGPPVRVEYEQAVEWICEALAPLGEAYVETTRRGCLEDRWVDVYPTTGKTGGAFSAGAQGTPPFIVMSYDDTATALGTLAHELGHSMHSYLAWEAQPPVYAGYSLFAAEVASNFHQVLLRAHLLRTVTDQALQLAVLDEAFSNFHRYLFVMPILASFERDVHERTERGEGLSAPVLTELMADLFGQGFGADVPLDRERVGITWAQFPHLYAPFYVFQYTTGISGAHALAERILAGEQGAAERYLAFLSAGGSQYPLDALRDAGVDLASPAPIETAFATLSALVDRLEELASRPS